VCLFNLYVCVINDLSLIVILRGGTDPNFRGFMIQARRVADNSPVGFFDATDGVNYQEVCDSDVSEIYYSSERDKK